MSLPERLRAAIDAAGAAGDLNPVETQSLSASLSDVRTNQVTTLDLATASRGLANLWEAGVHPAETAGPEPHSTVFEIPAGVAGHLSAGKSEWLVAMSEEFIRAIRKIDRKLQGRILEAISSICREPLTAKGNTVKPLTGERRGLWRYRIGNFRLIYQPDSATHQVVLLSFASRGKAYN